MAWPGASAAWPNSAACWSPAMPQIGTPHSAAWPKRPAEGRTSGSRLRGMSKVASSSSHQSPRWMSYSSVRDALLGSVACTCPPVSCHSSQLSTVPKASSPRAARCPAPGTWSSSQRSLVAEKYGSSTSPVSARMRGSRPWAFSCSHSGAVRRSCQTSARCSGSPVARSHSTVVSRWLVMPMAAIFTPARATASRAQASWSAQIWRASCSTQPGCGKCCASSRCATASSRPSRPNTSARELDVPWSSASRASIACPLE